MLLLRTVAVLLALAVASSEASSEAAAATVDASKCPLYEKCSYVKNVADSKEFVAGEGCPLKTGGCPYYDHHRDDRTLLDTVTEKSHKCPIAGKCPFYEDIKSGKKVNFSGEKCPLATTGCPYYKDVKDGDPTNCPLEKACPHFKKDYAQTGHAHHAHAGDSHDARECPHLKAQAEAAAKAAGETHDEL